MLIKLKHYAPLAWTFIEQINGWLFVKRFAGIQNIVETELDRSKHPRFCFSLVNANEIHQLSSIMTSMSKDYLKYFNPHKFDAKTFKRLLSNKSFVLMKAEVRDTGALAGYFFLRGFVIGRAFQGIVALPQYTCQGLGTEMWRLGGEICNKTGLKLHATISKDNKPSLKSVKRALHVHKVQDLDNNYILFRCRSKVLYDA